MTVRAALTGLGVVGLPLLLGVLQAQAQSVGIGPRLAIVRGSEGSPEGSQRFSGAVLRLGSGKTVIELAMDYRSGLTGDLTERITDIPIQGSLLVYPVRATIAPYLLGGIGWYSQKLQRFSPTGTTLGEPTTTRRMGYHAGFGGEVRVHRRVGLYGDYRYTFLHFGDDASAADSSVPRLIPFAERLKLSHEGSMFTWGASFYF